METKRYSLKPTGLIAAVAMSLVAGSAVAQGVADALRFNRNDLVGTARQQAMGGAFGALGADLSTVTINPAGLGVYRATEMGLTLGVNAINNESRYYDSKANEDRVRVPFSQIGFAFNNSLMREETTGLVGSTFYVGYNRIANYAGNEKYVDPFSHNSLLDYFCTEEQRKASMTGGLAYDAWMMNDTTFVNEVGDEIPISYNVWENYLGNGKLDVTFRQDGADGSGLVMVNKKVNTRGSKGDISFAYAANISNKVFVGGSLSIIALGYEETMLHQEVFDGYTVVANAPTSYTYRSYLDQNGAGVNFKLGVIVKPVNALRLGFALHSPTFLSLNEKYYAELNNPNHPTGRVERTVDFESEYRYRSPSRIIASIAGVIGHYGLISVDYERQNEAKSKFKADDDDLTDYQEDAAMDGINEVMKNYILQASNTLRVGAEVSVFQPMYLRLGYRMKTSPITSDYYYTKPKDTAISGGIGYRMNNFFIDATYVCGKRVGDYWVMPDTSEGYIYETNFPAKLTTKTHSAVVTVGFRF
ncbi:MAG: hypothetical protein II951_06120 [Bacteroidales bacterium]|nr:hypothetical protein [Bacteroidales bacterium]